MNLPVVAALGELRTALALHAAAVLVAPPGTGKTTVVPPALLAEPWLADRRIVVLEPRRLAARAAAARMASQHGEEVGGRFGYAVRHDRRVGPRTRVEVVTEGLLTRRLQTDPGLDGVALVVLDEFHERSLDVDLALALLLDVQAALRPDLRLLVMSATLDSAAVAALLGGDGAPAPVVAAESPMHAVDTRWRPGSAHDRLEQRVGEVVLEAVRNDPGDVLVFLPGRAEIARTARWLRERGRLTGAELHELHGSVPAAEQDRLLRGHHGGPRRVILSTSIAETSVTVPGVRVVVDAGRRRTQAVDPRSGLPALVTGPVSQAGAEQRRGRAGREAPGVCYRLWSEAEHRHRPRHDPPEIVGADLSALVLQTAEWGVGDPCDLRWLDPPPAPALRRAESLLADLDALDDRGLLTARGRELARLGMTPRLAAVAAAGRDLGGEGSAVAAGDGGGGADESVSELALEVAALVEVGEPGGVELAERVRELRLSGGSPEVRRVLRQWRRRLGPARRGGRAGSRRSAAERETVERAADGRAARDRAPSDRAVGDRASGGSTADDVAFDRAVGRLVLAGFADRVAHRRSALRGSRGDRRAVYLLRHGGEVALDAGSPLARHEWIVVLDLDAATGSGRPGRVHLAAALHPDDARALVDAHGTEDRDARWDPDSARLVATITSRLDAITVQVRPWRDPDPAAIGVALRAAALELGPAMLPRWSEADSLRARVAFASTHGLPCAGGEWPDWSDEALGATAEDWLAPLLSGARGGADLARLDVRGALEATLGWQARQALDAEVPKEWVAPDRRRFPLAYGAVDGDPGSVLLSVRLQRLLGIDVQPRVSSREVPVTVELLSPANRPVQRTTDLPGFWRGSYAQVRAELRSKYRKHDWPEHPV